MHTCKQPPSIHGKRSSGFEKGEVRVTGQAFLGKPNLFTNARLKLFPQGHEVKIEAAYHCWLKDAKCEFEVEYIFSAFK